MADKKISELISITGSATAADDFFVVVDTSGAVTHKISRAELNNAIEQDVLSTVDINGGTIDGTVIGATTPAAGDFTTISSNKGSAGTLATFTDGVNSNFVIETSSLLTTIGNGGGSTALALKANNTEAMRISGGNVGIGNSTPSSFYSLADNLVVGTGSGGNGITIYSGSADSGYIGFNDTASASMQGFIQYNHSGDYMAFAPNGSEKVRIDSSGNVGIGGSDTSYGKFSVRGGYVYINEDNANTNQIYIRSDFGGDPAIQVATSHALKFATSNQERMRIDSSGNVLVGKTASNVAAEGAEIRSSGFTGLTVDGGAGLTIRRLTSDGELQSFFKDTTKVGSIGSRDGFFTIYNGDTGIGFDEANDHIRPVTSTGSRDAAIDLGRSATRFKDLYLSGGVYLGGTGSANHLDSYEEGSWTPNPVSTGATFITSAVGKYTKVGNLVFITMYLDNASAPTGTLTNTMLIYGLPFANNSGGYGCILTVGMLTGVDVPSSKYQVAARIGNGASFITPEWYQDNSGVTNMTAQDFDGGDARLVITGLYYTDS